METPIDRPGELLNAAFNNAQEHLRADVRDAIDPRDGSKAPIIVTQVGIQAVDPAIFDQYRSAPIRRKGTAKFERIESFIDHVNRFKDADSAIFADSNPAAPKMTAVLNYNRAGTIDEAAPRFGDHRSSYPFPLSPEWNAWFGQNAKAMSMIEFASFLEDHIVDVLPDPGELSAAATNFVTSTGGKFATPTKLIEIARGLQINESSVVKETRNLSTGEAEITFDTTHTGADGKPIKMPNLFIICIPVFERASVSYRLIARLRYRKTGGGLVFFYELWRPDLIFNDAFEEAIEEVRAKTELSVFIGNPEA